jgi:hypothetical protein
MKHFSRLRAALRTHGERNETSVLGCAVVGAALLLLVALLCALAVGR